MKRSTTRSLTKKNDGRCLTIAAASLAIELWLQSTGPGLLAELESLTRSQDMYRTLAEVVEGIERGIRESRRPEDRKLAHDYLAALAPLLASSVLGKDILRELPVFERVLGHTWLIDDTPFREALSKWRLFREEYERFALSSMTVNERLVALGTLEAFDRAKAARDYEEVKRLLTQAKVDVASISRIIEDL